MTDMLLKD